MAALRGLQLNAEDQLVDLYRQGYLDIAKAIEQKAAKGSLGTFERSLLVDVSRTLAQLDNDVVGWTQRELPKMTALGMNASIRAMAQAGVQREPMTAESFAIIHQHSIDALAKNMVYSMRKAHEFVGRKIQDDWREVALKAVAAKRTTGLTLLEAKKGLMRKIGDEGLGAFVDRRGRTWRLDTYAAMVTRTTSREAANSGLMDQLINYGEDLVQIDHHARECDICAPYAGKVYSITGRDKRFLPLRALPGYGLGYNTMHPNCRHVLLPYVEDLENDVAGDIARSNSQPVDTRTKAERDAYERDQEVKRLRMVDRQQWESYKAWCPNDTPTFAGFRRMKAANSKRYQDLQGLYRDARRGQVITLVPPVVVPPVPVRVAPQRFVLPLKPTKADYQQAYTHSFDTVYRLRQEHANLNVALHKTIRGTPEWDAALKARNDFLMLNEAEPFYKDALLYERKARPTGIRPAAHKVRDVLVKNELDGVSLSGEKAYRDLGDIARKDIEKRTAAKVKVNVERTKELQKQEDALYDEKGTLGFGQWDRYVNKYGFDRGTWPQNVQDEFTAERSALNVSYQPKFKVLDDMRARLFQEGLDILQDRAQDARSFVAEVRNVGLPKGMTQKFATNSTLPVMQEVNATLEWLPRKWATRQSVRDLEAIMSPTGRAFNDLDKIALDSRGILAANHHSQTLHEFMHQIERVVSNFGDLEKELYARRTAGEALIRLDMVCPGYGYKPNELTRLDKFVDPYQGKDYGSSAGEVFSMGSEIFSPVGSRNMWSDKEVTNLLLGVFLAL